MIFFLSDFGNSLKEGAYNNTVLGRLFHHFTLFWVFFPSCSFYILERRTATLNQSDMHISW